MFELATGRYFHASELERGSRALVLGSRAAAELFPLGNAVGQRVQVMGQRLKVVGVLVAEGNNSLGTSLDEEFLVPINLVRRVKGGDPDEVNPLILAGPAAGVPVAELKAELRGHLRAFRRLKPTQEDNFAINQVSFLANQLDIEEFQPYPSNLAPSLHELSNLTDHDWNIRFPASALRRIKPAMFRRNAKAVMTTRP